MQNIILIGHLVLALAIVLVVLLQRTEGGALGIGGGNEMQGGRKPSNPLVRLTTILGISFFATSLGLTLLAQRTDSVLDGLEQPNQPLMIPTPAAPIDPKAIRDKRLEIKPNADKADK